MFSILSEITRSGSFEHQLLSGTSASGLTCYSHGNELGISEGVGGAGKCARPQTEPRGKGAMVSPS